MKFIVITCLLIFVQTTQAESSTGQGRLFIGSTKIDPKDLNSELESENLKSLDAITQYGVEITFPVTNFLNTGLRYTKKATFADEKDSSSTTNFESKISQEAMLAVARLLVKKTDSAYFDTFIAVGGTNTDFKINSATQDGELDKKNSFFANPVYSAGASVAVGFKKVYFVIETGYEYNLVDKLKSSGTVNSNVDKINLSGGYVTVGLMFDGIPISPLK